MKLEQENREKIILPSICEVGKSLMVLGEYCTMANSGLHGRPLLGGDVTVEPEIGK